MPFLDDEEDVAAEEKSAETPKTGGSLLQEWKALGEGNEEPEFDAAAACDPYFPANVVWMPDGKKNALPAWAKILWFRMSHPEWSVEFEDISITNKEARIRCTIKNEKGRVMCQATKSWSYSKNVGFYMECAETGSYARALEFLGFSAERALALRAFDLNKKPE